MQTERSLTKSVPFFQEPDLRYLVENIWNSQSVLSAHEDLFDLILVRWNKCEEWSPWNCILLTKEEASAHPNWKTLLRYGSFSLFVFVVLKQSSIDGCGKMLE